MPESRNHRDCSGTPDRRRGTDSDSAASTTPDETLKLLSLPASARTVTTVAKFRILQKLWLYDEVRLLRNCSNLKVWFKELHQINRVTNAPSLSTRSPKYEFTHANQGYDVAENIIAPI